MRLAVSVDLNQTVLGYVQEGRGARRLVIKPASKSPNVNTTIQY